MAVTALAPWYGSNRLLAEHVGRALDGCTWVGVPFAGGMCELGHIKARTLAVNDLHREVINLAEVVAHPALGAKLIRALRRESFHPDTLAAAQDFLAHADPPHPTHAERGEWDLQHARAYFVCAWMTRSGSAGTPGELTAGLSFRWESGGGDSAVRFRSAVESLRAWQRVLRRASFTCLDVFEFLAKCRDADGHGLYLDPPFPGPGDRYRHPFTEDQHRRLAERLAEFDRCRVVCRFYDHPLIREIYPAERWTTLRLSGRTQANIEAPELLLLRNPAGG